jgi:2-dehydro-3-deoxygalactonokinase
MYFACIDCGTTNSRVYILDDEYRVVGKGLRKVGVRDTVINGSNKVLKEGLKEVFEDTVRNTGLTVRDIQFVVTSGMITSEIGLIEIPHIWTPAGIDELAENVKVVRDPTIFPVDLPVIFIPGTKNSFPHDIRYGDMRRVDFMRGEETQVAGLISRYQGLEYPVIMTTLTSHTKFTYINEDKKIAGSVTTLSGQVYEAITEMTSIGKSMKRPPGLNGKEGYFNEELIDAAFHSVKNAGFLRTLMMPRFMEVLLETEWYERELFFSSAIACEDLRALNDFDLLGFKKESSFVLVGHKERSRLYGYLLKEQYGAVKHIQQISEEEQIDRLAIDGAIAVAKKAGYLS